MSAVGQQLDIEGILLRCREGDEDAWHEVVDRYRNLVRSICLRLGVHDTHSADIVQETLLALYRNLDKIQASEALSSWLSTTATRLAYRHLSKKRLHLALEDGESLPSEDLTAVVLDLHELREKRAAIETALGSLSVDNAELVRMLYIEGLSYSEISSRTGRPAGSIGPTRMRCLAKLRQLLQKEQYAWAS